MILYSVSCPYISYLLSPTFCTFADGDDQRVDLAGTFCYAVTQCKHQLTTVGKTPLHFTDRSGLSTRLQQCLDKEAVDVLLSRMLREL